ncbi:MAG: hypothetical protein JNJ59_18700 [Deltaproteobacteria bacterium]|nr:hypothetical protein [Deltaproteobacteria bacterium]
MPTWLLIVPAVLGLVTFIALWRRYPRRRTLLVVASTLAIGASIFAAWWVLFRIDDPTFAADQARAKDTQKALDDALGKDF